METVFNLLQSSFWSLLYSVRCCGLPVFKVLLLILFCVGSIILDVVTSLCLFLLCIHSQPTSGDISRVG
jgi:hypothetical protein